MLTCQIIHKDNDRTSKGRQDVSTSIMVESGPISKGFQNINITVATNTIGPPPL
jgi:hypothetical protein